MVEKNRYEAEIRESAEALFGLIAKAERAVKDGKVTRSEYENASLFAVTVWQMALRPDPEDRGLFKKYLGECRALVRRCGEAGVFSDGLVRRLDSGYAAQEEALR